MSRILAVALAVFLPALALADEGGIGSAKFNPKQIEKDFAPLLVFADAKGRPAPAVDNEVTISKDEEKDQTQASWVVRQPMKKVLDFYTTKLSVKPEKKGEEALGTVHYEFTVPLKKGDKRAYKVKLLPTEGGVDGVQIVFVNRALTDDDTVPE